MSKNIRATIKNPKALEWIKLITITSSAQIVVQGVGAISGILIIRLFSTKEYALYTLANSMLMTMIVLADSGIAAGVMSQGGKVWQDRVKLGTVLAVGLDLRKKFAIASLIISVPLLLYQLLHHDASWFTSLIIIFSLIPAFLSALTGELLEIAPKLKQDIAPLQKNQVKLHLVRLVLTFTIIYFFPWAFLALLASGISQLWANVNLKKISDKHAKQEQKSDLIIRAAILAVVKRQLPSSIYHCFSGQITIWLVSAFGSTLAVAQIGALGRIALLPGLLTLLFSIIILPRYARLPKDQTILLNYFIKIQIGWLIVSAAIIGIFWVFSTEILWILGPKYSALRKEALLITITSCINLFSGSAFNLYTSRGWILNPIISIAINTITIASGVAFIDVSSLQGVLVLSIFVAVIQAIANTLYAFLQIIKSNNIINYDNVV
ncbi:lipopolysaccharide biosynthesis protein [Spirosoma foliorum]|uniref:Polysaccharide biosynthesis protein n=1 Tax=Spirosoma foliorum TaxID=2710596 RepID=A0A7G5GSL2_9BACT|nr:polysaccharide biosynthesis protein [Spirosoma foliorum]QMW01854.1 polysaccharide biosynthesis protein [Spirosoma foliorum]